MIADNDYEFRFWEEKARYAAEGGLTYHPVANLNSSVDSYGFILDRHFTFQLSPVLDGIGVFRFEFDSPRDYVNSTESVVYRHILDRLQFAGNHWYISAVGDVRDGNSNGFTPLEQFVHARFDFPSLEVEEHPVLNDWMPNAEYVTKRTFFEIPEKLMPAVAGLFWTNAAPGNPIYGLQMAPEQLHLLQKWNARWPGDVDLLREVIDQCFLMFFTYPSENRHLVILTNKLSEEDIAGRIDISTLRDLL